MRLFLAILVLGFSGACGPKTSQYCKDTSQVINGTRSPQCTCQSNGYVFVTQTECGG